MNGTKLVLIAILSSLNKSISQQSLVFDQSDAIKTVLDKYPVRDSLLLPIPNGDPRLPMTIEMTIQIGYFEGIDDVNEEISFVGISFISWADPLLQFNHDSFKNDSNFYFGVKPTAIWTPNVVMLNSMDGMFIVSEYGKKSQMAVYPSGGLVYWYPSGRFKAQCKLDLTYFPFDQQLCNFTFAIWDHITEKIIFKNVSNEYSVFTKSGPLRPNQLQSNLWTLVKVNSVYQPQLSVDGEYSFVDFEFIVSRRPLYYIYIVVFPIGLVSLIQTIGQLHPHGPERPSFFMVLLLALWVIQQGRIPNIFLTDCQFLFQL